MPKSKHTKHVSQPRFRSKEDVIDIILPALIDNITKGRSYDVITSAYNAVFQHYNQDRIDNPQDKKLPPLRDSDFLLRIDENKNTPMHLACLHGTLDLVQWLWEKGGNTYDQNIDGNTPAHLACLAGNHEIAAWMIQREAPTKTTNKMGFTVGDLYGGRDGSKRTPEFLEACKKKAIELKDSTEIDFDTLKYQFGECNIRHILNAPLDESADRLLHHALAQGKHDLAKEFIRYGADLTIRNKQKISAQDMIDKQECLKEMPILLTQIRATDSKFDLTKIKQKHGAENVKKYILNAKDHSGNTLLHYAIFAGRADVAKELVSSGADISATNSTGQSPESYMKFVAQETQAVHSKVPTFIGWGPKSVDEAITKFQECEKIKKANPQLFPPKEKQPVVTTSVEVKAAATEPVKPKEQKKEVLQEAKAKKVVTSTTKEELLSAFCRNVTNALEAERETELNIDKHMKDFGLNREEALDALKDTSFLGMAMFRSHYKNALEILRFRSNINGDVLITDDYVIESVNRTFESARPEVKAFLKIGAPISQIIKCAQVFKDIHSEYQLHSEGINEIIKSYGIDIGSSGLQLNTAIKNAISKPFVLSNRRDPMVPFLQEIEAKLKEKYHVDFNILSRYNEIKADIYPVKTLEDALCTIIRYESGPTDINPEQAKFVLTTPETTKISTPAAASADSSAVYDTKDEVKPAAKAAEPAPVKKAESNVVKTQTPAQIQQEKLNEFVKDVKDKLTKYLYYEVTSSAEGIINTSSGVPLSQISKAIKDHKLIDLAIDKNMYSHAFELLKYATDPDHADLYSLDSFINSINKCLDDAQHKVAWDVWVRLQEQSIYRQYTKTPIYPARDIESAMKCWAFHEKSIAHHTKTPFVLTRPKTEQEKANEFAQFVKAKIPTKEGILFSKLAEENKDGMTQDEKIKAIKDKKLIEFAIEKGKPYGALTLLKFKSKLENQRDYRKEKFVEEINVFLKGISSKIPGYPAPGLGSALKCWLTYEQKIAKAGEEFIIGVSKPISQMDVASTAPSAPKEDVKTAESSVKASQKTPEASVSQAINMKNAKECYEAILRTIYDKTQRKVTVFTALEQRYGKQEALYALNMKDTDGNTILHHAIIAKRALTAEYYIENGANPSIENNIGVTPASFIEHMRTIGESDAASEVDSVLDNSHQISNLYEAIKYALKKRINTALFNEKPQRKLVEPLSQAAYGEKDTITELFKALDEKESGAHNHADASLLAGDNDVFLA